MTEVEYFIYVLFGEALNVLMPSFPKKTVFLNNTKAAHIPTIQTLRSSLTTLAPVFLIIMSCEGHFISAHGDHEQF